MHPAAALPGWPLLLHAEWAAGYVSLSVSMMRAEVAAGRFPRPHQITAGRVAWLRDDLDAWARAKAGRPAAATADDWLTP